MHLFAVPVSLLRVSKAFYGDTLPLLYSANTLMVTEPEGLSTLNGLTDNALIKATSFCINLAKRPPYHHNYASFADEAIRSAWESTVQRLRPILAPDRVRWTFVCVCKTEAQAEKMYQLLKDLSKAHEASVRFHKTPGRLGIVGIAQRSVREMMYGKGEPPLVQFVRYNDLPREVQREIVKATDISTLSKDLYSSQAHLVVAHNRLQIRQDFCCKRCSTSADMCCCPNRHSAASSSCCCAPDPDTFLRASRALRDTTYEVTLLQTVVVFRDRPESTLRFLRMMPQHTLKFFRCVQLRFDPLQGPEEDRVGHSRKSDVWWRALVSFITDSFDLTQLGLAIYAECADLDRLPREQRLRESDSWDWYADGILPPLRKQLEGKSLRSFHVNFRQGDFIELEHVTEVAVMGQVYDPFTDKYLMKQPWGRHGWW